MCEKDYSREEIAKMVNELSYMELASFWLELGDELVNSTFWGDWECQRFIDLDGVRIEAPFRSGIPTPVLAAQGYLQMGILKGLVQREHRAVLNQGVGGLWELLLDQDVFSDDEIQSIMECIIDRWKCDVHTVMTKRKEMPFLNSIYYFWGIGR